MREESYRSLGLTILERDDRAILATLQTDEGLVTLIATYRLSGRTLHLTQVHVDGEGLHLALIRRVAKVIRDVEDVDEVLIEGGRRSSGKFAGKIPRTIRVGVEL